MHIVLTVSQGLILFAGFWLLRVAMRVGDDARKDANRAETAQLRLALERDRVTVLEREVDALRRELRKLSGKFYAAQREYDERPEDELQAARGYADSLIEQRGGPVPTLGACEKWLLAQREGPHSEAARCECQYCVSRRAERARLRAELVPKTVQGQAETAKLNAGKP